MTHEEARKVALLIEDCVPHEFDTGKLAARLRKDFPEIGWDVIQQCPVIVMASDSR